VEIATYAIIGVAVAQLFYVRSWHWVGASELLKIRARTSRLKLKLRTRRLPQ